MSVVRIKTKNSECFSFEKKSESFQEFLSEKYKKEKVFCCCRGKNFDGLELTIAFKNNSGYELKKVLGQDSKLHSSDCVFSKSGLAKKTTHFFSGKEIAFKFPSYTNNWLSDHESMSKLLDVLMIHVNEIQLGNRNWNHIFKSLRKVSHEISFGEVGLQIMLNILTPSTEDKEIWFGNNKSRILFGELERVITVESRSSIGLKFKGAKDVIWYNNSPEFLSYDTSALKFCSDSEKLIALLLVRKTKQGSLIGSAFSSRVLDSRFE